MYSDVTTRNVRVYKFTYTGSKWTVLVNITQLLYHSERFSPVT